MKPFIKVISILMLLFSIGFNLWIYRAEPTAKADPNDNLFQYALVHRTNEIWDYMNSECTSKFKVQNSNFLSNFAFCMSNFAVLIDHWVPNWAEGYNLPFYYSHVPQIVIVGSYRLLTAFSQCQLLNAECQITLFQYYHWVIYLLLCFFPLSVFLALRVIKQPWLTAGFAALLATHLSTDGLYGLDPSSYLWRGYGLSSQLFAMIWLPLAIAYLWRYFSENSIFKIQNSKQIQISKSKTQILLFGMWHLIYGIGPTAFFLIATTLAHLGIGTMVIMSIPVFAYGQIFWDSISQQSFKPIIHGWKIPTIRFIVLFGVTLFFLSYWLIPILQTNDYHNISFWDPVWKFNSYGWKETIARLLDGHLFDFGRLPVFSFLIAVGLFAGLAPKTSSVEPSTAKENSPLLAPYPLLSFSVLFIFWLVLYFGRTTWGPLIDLIPGMKDFHISRFLVMLHIAGLFLAPIGLNCILQQINKLTMQQINRKRFVNWSTSYFANWFICQLVTLSIGLFVIVPIYQQTLNYNKDNIRLITRANENYERDHVAVDELISTLQALPRGRVFAGRGSSWGKELLVGETTYYLYLSTYGIETVFWLPETWSPNSDTEQFINDSKPEDYDLYNIQYVVTPLSVDPLPFWSLVKETPVWRLYSVKTDGYITSGVRPAIVSVDKTNFVNLVHLWIHSPYPSQNLFPELTFDASYPKSTGLPNFKMLDAATYTTPDKRIYSLFADIPRYEAPLADSYNEIKITDQHQKAGMQYDATVTVTGTCTECHVILKVTNHPNWQVIVNGKRASTRTVFPFYIATPISEPGTYAVSFRYKPSPLKILLALGTIMGILSLGILRIKQKR